MTTSLLIKMTSSCINNADAVWLEKKTKIKPVYINNCDRKFTERLGLTEKFITTGNI